MKSIIVFALSFNIQPSPPAPGGPHGGGTPPKPTGVGAVRAKRGEAAMFQSGDSAPGGWLNSWRKWFGCRRNHSL
jgi:hypothetical protein